MPDTDTLMVAADVVGRGTLALVVGAFVALALRRAPAAARHLAWGFTFVALLAIPALRLGLPGWPVVVRRTAAVVPATIEAPRPVVVAFDEPTREPVTARLPETPKTVDRGIGLAIAEPSAPPIKPPAPGPTFAERLTTCVWAAWGAGVLIILGRLAAGLAGLGRPAVVPASAALIERAQRVCGGTFDPSRVVLRQGDRDLSPMTWGVVR
ncbi:MAG: hypothetical protein K2X91_06440, partial [Thermoleophilia bacterium]|nr:hypothetical protein [Thermoleophilia bacterium]